MVGGDEPETYCPQTNHDVWTRITIARAVEAERSADAASLKKQEIQKLIRRKTHKYYQSAVALLLQVR